MKWMNTIVLTFFLCGCAEIDNALGFTSRVEYRVSGAATQVSVRYNNEHGNSDAFPTSLPFVYRGVFHTGNRLLIGVTNMDNQPRILRCEIFAGDKRLDIEEENVLPSGRLSCSATTP
jgi:hypothetical protein